MRTSLRSLCCLLLCFYALPGLSQTQVGNEQGLLPYGSYHGGNVDSVNLKNGNLTVRIPLFSLPQRGKLSLSYSLVLNNQGFTMSQFCDDDTESSPDCYAQYLRTNPIGPMLVMDQAINLTQNYFPFPSTDCKGFGCGTEVLVASPQVNVVDSTGASHELLSDSNNWSLLHALDGSGYSYQTAYTAQNFQLWYGMPQDPNFSSSQCTFPDYGKPGDRRGVFW